MIYSPPRAFRLACLLTCALCVTSPSVTRGDTPRASASRPAVTSATDVATAAESLPATVPPVAAAVRDGDPGDTGERSISEPQTTAEEGAGAPTNGQDTSRGKPPRTLDERGEEGADPAVPAEELAPDQAPAPITPRRIVDGAVTLPWPPRGKVPALDPSAIYLRNQLVNTLRFYYQRSLNTQEVSAWSIMHAGLSFGVDSQVHRGHPQGPLVNALGWLCWNGVCRDRKMMYLQNDQLAVQEGPGFQGHPAQFLAILAQCRVGLDFQLRVDGRQYQVRDLLEREMLTCRGDQELTFKLIAFAHYLPSACEWKSENGEIWNLPRLVRTELALPLHGAACGGTHRLMAISYAAFARRSRGEPLDGAWAEAQARVNQYLQQTLALQNGDGSFSSQWYQRRADWGDMDRKFQTTGHMLEWLVFSLPDERLADRQVVKSVSYLNDLMVENRFYDWENGPRGHALRALVSYTNRRYGLSPRDYIPAATAQAQRTTAR